MNVIMKTRGLGKTCDLIRLSAEKQIPIVTLDTPQHLQEKADALGYQIPMPLKPSQVHSYAGADVLVDDAEKILPMLIGKTIDTLAMSPSYWSDHVGR